MHEARGETFGGLTRKGVPILPHREVPTHPRIDPMWRGRVGGVSRGLEEGKREQ